MRHETTRKRRGGGLRKRLTPDERALETLGPLAPATGDSHLRCPHRAKGDKVLVPRQVFHVLPPGRVRHGHARRESPCSTAPPGSGPSGSRRMSGRNLTTKARGWPAVTPASPLAARQNLNYLVALRRLCARGRDPHSGPTCQAARRLRFREWGESGQPRRETGGPGPLWRVDKLLVGNVAGQLWQCVAR